MTVPIRPTAPTFSGGFFHSNTQRDELQTAQRDTLSAFEINPLKAAVFTPPSVILSMADTFAESLSFGLVGENDMENFLDQHFGEFGDFFNENRGAVGVTGDIIGAFIPGTLAVKGIRSGSFFSRLLQNKAGKTASKYFISTGKSNTQIFAGQFRKAKALGKKGVVNTKNVRDFNQRSNRLLGRSVLDTIQEGIAADLAIAATMHESEFLFPEEMSTFDHLLFFGGFNAAFGVGAGLIAKRTLTRGVKKGLAEGARLTDTPVKELSRNVSSNIKGQRGPAIAVHAQLLKDTNDALTLARAEGDQIAIDAQTASQTAIKVRLKELTELAFLDSPIEGVTNSINLKKTRGFDAPEIRTAQAAYANDPNMALGLTSFEQFTVEAPKALNKNLLDKTQTVKADFRLTVGKLKQAKADLEAKNSKSNQKRFQRLLNKTQKLQNEINYLEKQTFIMVEVDGTTSALSTRADIFQDGTRSIARAQGISSVTLGDKAFEVGANGLIDKIPAAKALKNIDLTTKDTARKTITNDEFLKLSHIEKTAIFDLIQDQIERADLQTFQRLLINEKSTLPEKELAVGLIQKNEKFLDLIDGVNSLDELLVSSLKDKFVLFQKLRNNISNNLEDPLHNLDNIARALNLPTDDALLTFFEQSRLVNHIDETFLGIADINQLKLALKQHLQLPQDAQLIGQKFIGNMTRLARDNKPIIATMENIENRAAMNVEHLAEITTNLRAQQLDKLRNADSLVISEVMKILETHENVIKTFKDDLPTLVEGVGAHSFLTKPLGQQNFITRHDEVFQSADFIARELERANTNLIEKLLKTELRQAGIDSSSPLNKMAKTTKVRAKSYQEALNNVLARGRESDLTLTLTARNAVGAGWDLPKNPWVRTRGPNGNVLYQMKLKDTERNKQIWELMFNEKFPEDTAEVLLPVTGQRTPVVVTETGRDALQAINELSLQAFKEDAAIRQAKNLKPLTSKDFHLPPINLSKLHRAYLIDDTGNLRTVLGEDTESALRKRVEKEISAANTQGVNLHRIAEKTVEQYYEASSRAFFDMDNFVIPSNQTGPTKGTSFGTVVKTGSGAFKEMIDTTLRQYSNFARETTATVFSPEIQHLKLKKNAASPIDGSLGRTIYDDLISRLLGVQNLDTDTFVGKTLLTVENLYDNNLKFAYDSLTSKLPSLGLNQLKAEKTFKAVQGTVGKEFSPWNSVTKFIEQTDNARLPFNLRRHASLLNEATTAITIRIFDVGMAMINMLSLGSTLPPVVAMLGRLADETDAQRLKRIGAFSGISNDGNAYFSPAKTLTDAMHFMFTEEGKNVARRAADLGYFDQFAAEQVEIFARSGETFLPGFLRYATNKASILTDWSERKARGLSFMSFYRIGKQGLNLDDRAAMAFAHQQANNTIADFRPSNRPAIFQGAAGMPLGLFTTFMWNYLQRFASIIETLPVSPKQQLGSARIPFSQSAFIQTGLQASLFGAETLPGWQQFTQMFVDNYDGSVSPVDRFNEAIGPMATDVLMNGTLSNIPKLFGADTGISIGPRAAVGVPRLFTTGNPLQASAPLSVVNKIATTFSKVIDSQIQEKGIDTLHAAEIIGAANINKGLSNVIELTTGKSLDASGSIIEENTRSAMGIASRIAGFKPLFADELRQENVRNRSTDRVRTELKNRVANKLKSRIRNGRLTIQDVEDALDSYIRAGGNPQNFKRFFQSQVIRGTQTKIATEIEKAVRSSIDNHRIARLIYLSGD